LYQFNDEELQKYKIKIGPFNSPIVVRK